MSDFQCICTLISIFFLTVILPFFFETSSGKRLKKKICRKLNTIHLSEKRDAILRERLHLNHIEYRLLTEYNVRVYYNLCEESDTNADCDTYVIRIVDADTGEFIWNKISRQIELDADMTYVMEQLDKCHDWRVVW